MARVNVTASQFLGETHEGAPAYTISAEQELRRTVLACLLWEETFYESGKSVAERIAALVPQVEPERVAFLAIEARSQMYLRHVPLLLVREMTRHTSHRKFVRATLSGVIQRADELAEFLALYWAGGDRKKAKDKLAKSVQKGLADAFVRFNAYNLAKYNRDNPVKLRDVLFLSHAKPKDSEQAATWKQLIAGTLPTPDTWEVELSASKDKTASWTRLLEENKLGSLALIRNLRNMVEASVEDRLIRKALVEMKPDKVLPFRFVAAARIMPRFNAELEQAMLANLAEQAKLPGMTLVLVDVSGSMDGVLSAKSEMRRVDAAAGLAVFAREICESARVFSFSNRTVEVPAYRGLALVDAISKSQPHSSTELGAAVTALNKEKYDRLIVITDEQAARKVPGPNGKGYIINVASYKNGVGYGPWLHIDGWSEKVLDYIRAVEQ